MKKLIVVFCLATALLVLAALPAGADGEPALWPAYDEETHLWGYIREDGSWGIMPQYGYAGHFHHGCAVAGEASPDEGIEAQGVIDETGAYLLSPEYLIDHRCGDESSSGAGVTEVYTVRQGERMGWFNVENRFFSGVQWDSCWTRPGWPVMCAWVGGYRGYLDRETAEVIVPIEDCAWRPEGYSEGYFTVTFRDAEHAVLLDMQGREVVFPAGIHVEPESVMRSGLVAVINDAGLIGYANAQGEVVIEPQYLWAMDFQGGYAEVQHETQGHMLIDRNGHAVYQSEQEWGYHGEIDGSAFVYPHQGNPMLLNADGTARMTTQEPAFCYAAWYGEPLAEGAPLRLQAGVVGESYWCFIDARGAQTTQWLDRPGKFSRLCMDEMGWQAVTRAAGVPSWGYVDAWGKWMIPCQFHQAEDFQGALAWVAFDTQTQGYINRNGETVYQWTVPEEE